MNLFQRFATALLVAVALVGCAAAPAGSGMESKALVAALTAQADAWDRAIVAKDRRAIEANMADDFRQIDASGGVDTKTSFVDDLVSPDLRLDPYKVEDFDVRLYGDTALLSGRMRLTGQYQGKPINGHYRYIDIYVRREGAWTVVSVQMSRLPK